jgi:hypothetical protein
MCISGSALAVLAPYGVRSPPIRRAIRGFRSADGPRTRLRPAVRWGTAGRRVVRQSADEAEPSQQPADRPAEGPVRGASGGSAGAAVGAWPIVVVRGPPVTTRTRLDHGALSRVSRRCGRHGQRALSCGQLFALRRDGCAEVGDRGHARGRGQDGRARRAPIVTARASANRTLRYRIPHEGPALHQPVTPMGRCRRVRGRPPIWASLTLVTDSRIRGRR